MSDGMIFDGRRSPRFRGDIGIDEAGLVQGVGVDRHLDIEFVGDGETAIDRRRCRPPVLVQLERANARFHLCA